MVDFKKLKKGSKIEEYKCDITISSTICSDVKYNKNTGEYTFESITASNSLVSYLVGGGGDYSAFIGVVEY